MANDFLADVRTIISIPWRNKTVLQKAYTVAVVLLAIAVMPVPYEYYVSMRLGVCACLYFYYQEATRRKDLNPAWTYVLIAIAVLYNPVIPIHLGIQAIWTVINAGTVFFLYRARLAIEVPLESTRSTEDTITGDRQPDTAAAAEPQIIPRTIGEDGFNAYQTEFINEVKRLSGKTESDLHWIELTDDEGTRRAYSDGVDPKALAAAFMEYGKPPLPPEFTD